MTDDLEGLVDLAQGGDKVALEELVVRIQDGVYHLALRMLVNAEDALDATQEILILVVTRLSTFEGRSRFRTWVYRVASNYLLNSRKAKAREQGLTFEAFAEDLEEGLVEDVVEPAAAETQTLLSELRISCTMAMLLCLDPKHRMAYVLGEVLELDHVEAAEVLDISRANFRKRLSRARAAVLEFTSQRCGVANESAKCSCPRRLPAALRLGRVDPEHLRFAAAGGDHSEVLAETRRLEGELRALKVHQSIPRYDSPRDFGAVVAQIVEGQRVN